MRKKKFFPITVALFFFFHTPSYPRSDPVNLITMSAGFSAPYTLPDKTGFFDILGKELFERIDHRFALMPLPAKRAIHSANNGDTDGDLQRIIGLEKHYPNLIRVPEIVSIFNFVAFSKNPATRLSTWDDLKGLRVGYIRGWAFYKQNVPDEAQVILADNPKQLMSLLKLGRLDIILYSKWMGLWWAREMGLKIYLVDPPLRTEDMYMYLHKKNAFLVPQLADALKKNERRRPLSANHQSDDSSLAELILKRNTTPLIIVYLMDYNLTYKLPSFKNRGNYENVNGNKGC